MTSDFEAQSLSRVQCTLMLGILAYCDRWTVYAERSIIYCILEI